MTGRGQDWSDELAYPVSERAYSLHTEGRYGEALALFQALLDLYPEDLYYMDAVAALHLALDRPDAAARLATAVLGRDPSHVRARVRLCEAHAVLGMFEEAESDIQQLRRLGAGGDAERMAMRLAASRSSRRLRG